MIRQIVMQERKHIRKKILRILLVLLSHPTIKRLGSAHNSYTFSFAHSFQTVQKGLQLIIIISVTREYSLDLCGETKL